MSYKQAFIKDLLWESDFNGYEYGYDNIPCIGFYSSQSLKVNVLIDYEDGRIIEIWSSEVE